MPRNTLIAQFPRTDWGRRVNEPHEKAHVLSDETKTIIANANRNSRLTVPARRPAEENKRFDSILPNVNWMVDYRAADSPLLHFLWNSHSGSTEDQADKETIMRMINNQSIKKCVICKGLGHKALDTVHDVGLLPGAKYYKCSVI